MFSVSDPGLFEGDMILSPQQLEAARKGKLSYATTIGKQWPGKTVPYVYDLTISKYCNILSFQQPFGCFDISTK